MDRTGQGYRSTSYRAALSHLGQVEPLCDTGGFVLSREIPGTQQRDFMGPYPVLSCDDWGGLADALAALDGEHVSLTCVTDPFCPLSRADLEAMFDKVVPLHEHYIIDLEMPGPISKHHRKKLRKASPVWIEHRAPRPTDLEVWTALYQGLADKHGIDALRRFDAHSFAHQLAVPGAEIVLAWEGQTLLGADLYYFDGGVAYAHLSAYAARGYELSVSYQMMAYAIEAFAGQMQFIDMGGAPMTANAGGVGHFKRGWTDQTRTAHLCGKILNAAAFDKLCHGLPTGYFPPYRAGEFDRK
ncbi:GNAT family N-acetyltransferase [Flavimaricola marinus]|nr:GNAT family N-acetyltransferase [Flavimaricola marinus]